RVGSYDPKRQNTTNDQASFSARPLCLQRGPAASGESRSGVFRLAEDDIESLRRCRLVGGFQDVEKALLAAPEREAAQPLRQGGGHRRRRHLADEIVPLC